jgi:hypothetical protein
LFTLLIFIRPVVNRQQKKNGKGLLSRWAIPLEWWRKRKFYHRRVRGTLRNFTPEETGQSPVLHTHG